MVGLAPFRLSPALADSGVLTLQAVGLGPQLQRPGTWARARLQPPSSELSPHNPLSLRHHRGARPDQRPTPRLLDLEEATRRRVSEVKEQLSVIPSENVGSDNHPGPDGKGQQNQELSL